jgi:hypothetical protein
VLVAMKRQPGFSRMHSVAAGRQEGSGATVGASNAKPGS